MSSLFEDTPDYMRGDEEEDEEEVFLGSTLTRPAGAPSSASQAAATQSQTISAMVGGRAGAATTSTQQRQAAGQAYIDARQKEQGSQPAPSVQPKPAEYLDPRVMASRIVQPTAGKPSVTPSGFVPSTPADVMAATSGSYMEPMLPMEQGGRSWLTYLVGGAVVLGLGYGAVKYGPRLLRRS